MVLNMFIYARESSKVPRTTDVMQGVEIIVIGCALVYRSIGSMVGLAQASL